jgi:peptidoglycan-associated lipoprotein
MLMRRIQLQWEKIMTVRRHSTMPLLVTLFIAGGLACRKPVPAAQPEQPQAVAVQEQPKPVDQALRNDDAELKRKADEATEAARQAAAMHEAEYRKAADAALRDVHFNFDKADVMENDKPVLVAIAAFMKNYPQANVAIDGNCDERGTGEYNLALGERRAAATMDYLGNLGVAASRLSSMSYGKEKPVCTESMESCWLRNRRAHFALK